MLLFQTHLNSLKMEYQEINDQITYISVVQLYIPGSLRIQFQ